MYVWSSHVVLYINRIRLPILLVVSWTRKMNISVSPFAPENLASRDGFGRPVRRQPAHSTYSDWMWCLRAGFLLISAAASMLIYTAILHRVSSESIGSSNRVPMAFNAESSPARASKSQGSSSNGCYLCSSPWTN